MTQHKNLTRKRKRETRRRSVGVMRWSIVALVSAVLLAAISDGMAQKRKSSSSSVRSKNSSRSGSVKHSSSGTSGRGRADRGSNRGSSRDNRKEGKENRQGSRKEANENRRDQRDERYENSRRGRRWERGEERYDRHRRRVAIGRLMRVLPTGYQTRTVSHTTYYVHQDVYYVQTMDGGQVVYIVVESPY